MMNKLKYPMSTHQHNNLTDLERLLITAGDLIDNLPPRKGFPVECTFSKEYGKLYRRRKASSTKDTRRAAKLIADMQAFNT